MGRPRQYKNEFLVSSSTNMLYTEAQSLDQALSILDQRKSKSKRYQASYKAGRDRGEEQRRRPPVTLPKFSWDKE